MNHSYLFGAYSWNRDELFRVERVITLILRLLTLSVLVAVLTLHVRSLKIFKWEQSVSGGVLVTYLVAIVGLTLCTGMYHCHGTALQAYLCSTGAALLLVNAGAIWRRWKNTGEATQAMAELLSLLGVALKRQVKLKVILCVIAAILMMLDLATVPIIKSYDQNFNKK